MENNKRTAGTWKTEGLTVTCYGSGIICKCILPKDGGCFDAIGNAQIISKAVNEYDKLKEENESLKERLVKRTDMYWRESALRNVLQSERDLLIDALKGMVNDYERSRGLLSDTLLHPNYSKAKELLNNIKK